MIKIWALLVLMNGQVDGWVAVYDTQDECLADEIYGEEFFSDVEEPISFECRFVEMKLEE